MIHDVLSFFLSVSSAIFPLPQSAHVHTFMISLFIGIVSHLHIFLPVHITLHLPLAFVR